MVLYKQREQMCRKLLLIFKNVICCTCEIKQDFQENESLVFTSIGNRTLICELLVKKLTFNLKSLIVQQS